MRDDDLLRPWFEATMAAAPAHDLFDFHTHAGHNDPDGFAASAGDIAAALDLAGARGAVFAFHEPGGYRQVNDELIDAAAASDGRLVAFCRLDPNSEDARAEAERAIGRGARGIKLHPRAERFQVNDPAVRPVFELAHEERLPVVIHAGRGIPALGRHALELARELPGARVVLAHCGISDLSWIWREAQTTPNLYFDTSWWAPADVMALLGLVPPGQILFASDAPYGTPVQHSMFVLRCALQAGLDDDQLRCVMGAQGARLAAGEDPIDAGPAPGVRERSSDLLLQRAETFLHTSLGRLFSGLPGDEMLGLARLACYTGDEEPRADVFRSIIELLDLHEQHADNPPSPGARGMHLVITAICLAATPDVAVP